MPHAVVLISHQLTPSAESEVDALASSGQWAWHAASAGLDSAGSVVQPIRTRFYMTRILLTNDDGIHSDGLIKLEEALREVGDVYVVAPASEMSGASHSLTLARPLRIRQIDERHWTVDGTPTDCVTLALNKILPADELPDICASGINHGGNLGDDATYSAQSRARLEATILGVPGLAFSLVARENFDFTRSGAVCGHGRAKGSGRRACRKERCSTSIPAR